MKNTHYSFFFVKSVITTTYIPQNQAPQTGVNGFEPWKMEVLEGR